MTEPDHNWHDWKVGGRLLGIQMQPREIAAGLYAAGFRQVFNLSNAVKVCLAESQGYERAFNDNTTNLGSVHVGARVRNGETGELYEVLGVDGTMIRIANSSGAVEKFPPEALVVTSRDVGLMQINIPAVEIGTTAEEKLYEPTTNFAAAFRLWSQRGFEPWVAWSENVFLRDTYVKRANRGLGNWLCELDLAKLPTDVLGGGPYVHALTTPVLDYEYRLQGAVVALVEIEKQADHSPQIKEIAVRGITVAKS